MVHFDSVTILINTCNKISSIVRFFASLRSRLVVKRILEFLQSIKMLLKSANVVDTSGIAGSIEIVPRGGSPFWGLYVDEQSIKLHIAN